MPNTPTDHEEWIRNGKTFQDVRNDLQRKGLSETEITTYIRILDDKVTHQTVSRANRHHSRTRFYIGLCMFMVGAYIAVYSFITSGGTEIVIGLGGMVGGPTMMYYNRK